jgi:Mrp family chromosome partitioning ATPase
MVFFDSPPILGVSDASVIASSVDMTMVVVQHRRFPRSMLQRVKQGLTNVGAKIVGCVLNNTDIRHDEYYEYYTSYYQYYSPDQSANSSHRHHGHHDGEHRGGDVASTEGSHKEY